MLLLVFVTALTQFKTLCDLKYLQFKKRKGFELAYFMFWFSEGTTLVTESIIQLKTHLNSKFFNFEIPPFFENDSYVKCAYSDQSAHLQSPQCLPIRCIDPTMSKNCV